jgi:transposase
LDERGEIVLQEWVVTAPEAFFKRFRGETKMDIAMEVGTHSRWSSDLLGRCGHKVVVADPRQLGLITKNDAKSDKRDARTLAQLLRADARLLSPIKHRAEKLQTDLTVIRMRDNLIETRTRLVTSVRGVVKAVGYWFRRRAEARLLIAAQNCPLVPSACSCSRMYWRTCSSSNPTVETA